MDVIQLDEPAFNVDAYLDDVKAWGIEALNRAVEGLSVQTKEVLLGAIDVATERVEAPEEVAATIRGALAFVPPARVYPSTNCGMAPLPEEVARGKLVALTLEAAIVRAELGASTER